MENIWSHKYGANSKLYNVLMKGLPLSSRIYIWTYPVCFTVTKFPPATSIYVSIYTSEPGMKYECSGFMWQVALESKTQLVSCELSRKSLLEISTLEDIGAINAYIFFDLFCSLLFYNVVSIFLYLSMCFKLSISVKFIFQFPVSKNMQSNDPPIHIWSTFLVSNRHVQYNYF